MAEAIARYGIKTDKINPCTPEDGETTMALIQIQVPDIGDFDEVGVIELLVKPGDTVALEQSLITVESDKASMEIPSSHAGVVKALTVKVGDKVKQGSVIVELEAADGGAAAAPAPAAAPLPPRRPRWLPPLRPPLQQQLLAPSTCMYPTSATSRTWP